MRHISSYILLVINTKIIPAICTLQLQTIWKSINVASLSHRYVQLFTSWRKSFTLSIIQNRRGIRKKLITPEVIENILIIKVYLYTIHYVLTENFYDSFYTKICNYKLKVVRVCLLLRVPRVLEYYSNNWYN